MKLGRQRFVLAPNVGKLQKCTIKTVSLSYFFNATLKFVLHRCIYLIGELELILHSNWHFFRWGEFAEVFFFLIFYEFFGVLVFTFCWGTSMLQEFWNRNYYLVKKWHIANMKVWYVKLKPLPWITNTIVGLPVGSGKYWVQPAGALRLNSICDI